MSLHPRPMRGGRGRRLRPHRRARGGRLREGLRRPHHHTVRAVRAARRRRRPDAHRPADPRSALRLRRRLPARRWSGAASFAVLRARLRPAGRQRLHPGAPREPTARSAPPARRPAATEGRASARSPRRLSGTVRRGMAARHRTRRRSCSSTAATGATSATCQSGTLRWKARSAPEPRLRRADLRRPAARHRALAQRAQGRRLWVSGPLRARARARFAIGEELINFPIPHGALRRHAGPTKRRGATRSGGVQAPRRVAPRARPGRSRSSRRMDDAGATADTCDTTLCSWSTRSTKCATSAGRL